MPNNLYRRGDIWWARIQIRGRDVRRSLRTTSLVKAKKNLRALQDDIEHLRFYGDERRTWKSVVVEWAKAAPDAIKPNVFKRYLVSLRQVRPYLDHLYLDNIDRKVMAKVANRKGVSNATRRRDLTAVSSVLRFAVSQGWRDDNPAKEWDRSVIRERRDPIRLPDVAEIEAIVSIAPGNLANLIRFAQYTGMRQEEIGGLERKQVRYEPRAIDLWKTKSNRPRTVSMDERAAGTYIGTVPHLHSRWLFWHHEGERYRRISNQFNTLIKRATRDGLIENGFRFHDLRHWFAVDYLRRGGNIYDLQQELGHSSVQTTEIYLDFLKPDEQRKAKFGAGTKTGTATTVRGGDSARNDG